MRPTSTGLAIARWLLALLAASMAAAAILRLLTFLYVPWEAKSRGVETAYGMLADASYWAEAAWSLPPLALGIFALSLPFAIAVSAFPEARGDDPRIVRYAVVGGICPLFWTIVAATIYHSFEAETFRAIEVVELAARPELGFCMIAGVCSGYCFGRLRTAFR